jgi:hypothetical protein
MFNFPLTSGVAIFKRRTLLHCTDSYFVNFSKLSIHTIKNQAFDLFIMQLDKFTEEGNLKFTRLDNKDIIRLFEYLIKQI